MDGYGLNPLEQQVLVDGVHVCLLLCKDEYLSGKTNSSQGLTAWAPTSPPLALSPPKPSLVLGTLAPAWPGCTHRRGCLLQALEQVHHLGLLLHIFYFLPPQRSGQVILRLGLPPQPCHGPSSGPGGDQKPLAAKGWVP